MSTEASLGKRRSLAPRWVDVKTLQQGLPNATDAASGEGEGADQPQRAMPGSAASIGGVDQIDRANI